MNTRLQVEHGVTELVTGVDLVAAQLAVAGGEKLWFTQDDVVVTGHADPGPDRGRGPVVGVRAVARARSPRCAFRPGRGVRSDLGVEAGDTVAREYDSMFGKVLARGPDRDTARRRLAAALDELAVGGSRRRRPTCARCSTREDFAAVTHDTGSVERDWAPTAPPDPGGPAADRAGPTPAPGSESGAVRVRRVRIATDRGPVEIAIPSRVARSARADDGPTNHTGPTSGTAPAAPMDATVVDVPVVTGTTVAAGDVLVVLEAMKMEIEVRAPAAGTVSAVHVAAGASVAAGTVLAVVDAS